MKTEQAKATQNIRLACEWLITDMSGTETHDELTRTLYRMATTDIYNPNMAGYGYHAEKYLKMVKSCGRDWLMSVCNDTLIKSGF